LLQNFSQIGLVLLALAGPLWWLLPLIIPEIGALTWMIWKVPVLLIAWQGGIWLGLLLFGIFYGPAIFNDYFALKKSPWKLRWYRTKPKHGVPGHVALYNSNTGETFEGGFVSGTPEPGGAFRFRNSYRTQHDHLFEVPVNVDEWKLQQLEGRAGLYGADFNCHVPVWEAVSSKTTFFLLPMALTLLVGKAVLLLWALSKTTSVPILADFESAFDRSLYRLGPIAEAMWKDRMDDENIARTEETSSDPAEEDKLTEPPQPMTKSAPLEEMQPKKQRQDEIISAPDMPVDQRPDSAMRQDPGSEPQVERKPKRKKRQKKNYRRLNVKIRKGKIKVTARRPGKQESQIAAGSEVLLKTPDRREGNTIIGHWEKRKPDPCNPLEVEIDPVMIRNYLNRILRT